MELESQMQEIRNSHQTIQQFVEALKSVDDNAAASVVRQLRNGASLADLAQDISTGNLLLQLSDRPSLIGRREKAENSVTRPSEQTVVNNRSKVTTSPYEELFDLLRTASDRDAVDILRRIRQGHGIESTLRKAKEANPVAQLFLVPETRRWYQFPHRSSFPRFLEVGDNPYLSSHMYRATITGPSVPQVQTNDRQSTLNQALYTTPFHAAKMVDPYLWDIKASRWTNVTDDNHLVSELLNSYFLHHYAIYMGFHKDYFLEDLANGRTQFCSPLLVNTLLAAACHTSMSIPDRAKFWSPQNLAYQFLAEARRLWEMQDGQSSLTAIQAAIVLNTIYDCDTLDKIGRSYLLQAVAMAHDLKLFQSSSDKTMSKKMQRARTFTAWCLFAWDAMHSFHYRLLPLFDEEPESPLPCAHEQPSWYPEIYVRYPLDNTVVSIGFGPSMKAMVDLQHIAHDFARYYWGGYSQLPNDPLPFRLRLDGWLRDLPEPLKSRNIILPMHLRIHLEYYSILVSLIQVQRDTVPVLSSQPPAGSANPDDGEIGRQYVRIETLIRLYYVHHNLEIFDPYLIVNLLMLGNHVVDILDKGTSQGDNIELYRSTLVLCARGLCAQGKNSYIATMVYLTLRNRMKSRDHALLETYVHDEPSGDQESIIGYNRSNYPVPIIKIDEDPRTVLLAKLVKGYEALSVDQL
ncbi:hypothetical protein NW768_002684 [Fusarium equiseti]|uniref:Xylanolytic transcriptional activator regulatory domain-containing protein n=1 Tax=Fusarium equiseti TaxID=61235 RepID=A0ABQ8RPC1_FUSEQ|nr:hypothetical protein NW768_002684 [Fusarium equiseti]